MEPMSVFWREAGVEKAGGRKMLVVGYCWGVENCLRLDLFWSQGLLYSWKFLEAKKVVRPCGTYLGVGLLNLEKLVVGNFWKPKKVVRPCGTYLGVGAAGPGKTGGWKYLEAKKVVRPCGTYLGVGLLTWKNW